MRAVIRRGIADRRAAPRHRRRDRPAHADRGVHGPGPVRARDAGRRVRHPPGRRPAAGPVRPQLTRWISRRSGEAGCSAEADSYARLALENITREYPTLVSALLTGPGQFPRQPRDRTPVFYGSYDWHSCVEMHWVLVRLLKAVPGAVPAAEIRSALDAQLTPDGLARGGRVRPPQRDRPAALRLGLGAELSHELASWTGDADARRWAAAMEPLAEALTGELPALAAQGHLPDPRRGPSPTARSRCPWPCLTRGCLTAAGGPTVPGHRGRRPPLVRRRHRLPGRLGAFRARLPVARADRGRADGPAAAGREFSAWLTAFLPGLQRPGSLAALFTPAVVSDPSDGQIAHLHGLNLSRAWCFRRLAESLPPGRPARRGLRRRHAHARRGVPAARGQRPLHGHPLARRLRRPSVLQLIPPVSRRCAGAPASGW